MASDLRRAALFELVSRSTAVRAARYHEHASRLREMADAENLGWLRNDLLGLADQYEGLAATAEISPEC